MHQGKCDEIFLVLLWYMLISCITITAWFGKFTIFCCPGEFEWNLLIFLPIKSTITIYIASLDFTIILMFNSFPRLSRHFSFQGFTFFFLLLSLTRNLKICNYILWMCMCNDVFCIIKTKKKKKIILCASDASVDVDILGTLAHYGSDT